LKFVAKLVYSTITSLDGFIADENGDFAWATPDAELFTFINDIERRFGTNLYGRRMYETMVYWETFDASGHQPPYIRDFTMMWRAADKVVFSTTLQEVSSERTRIEPRFDIDEVRQLKQSSEHDVSIGGANLAGQAIKAGLADEMHLFVSPVAVGGGTPALPQRFRSKLELVTIDRFASGVVHLEYRPFA
jgi:dihydrofolate reductase